MIIKLLQLLKTLILISKKVKNSGKRSDKLIEKNIKKWIIRIKIIDLTKIIEKI